MMTGRDHVPVPVVLALAEEEAARAARRRRRPPVRSGHAVGLYLIIAVLLAGTSLSPLVAFLGATLLLAVLAWVRRLRWRQ